MMVDGSLSGVMLATGLLLGNVSACFLFFVSDLDEKLFVLVAWTQRKLSTKKGRPPIRAGKLYHPLASDPMMGILALLSVGLHFEK
jgi:hypothetical protein